jgi:cation:H+ antiporter
VAWLLFLGGLAGLLIGAEGLIKGACRIAVSLGISRIIVGLTVVAFGTSAPEMGISVASALGGTGDVAIGNVVGSNIANVFLILGAAAVTAPLLAHRQVVKFDIPAMLLVTLAASLLMVDGRVGPVDGGILLLGAAVYLTLLVRMAKKGAVKVDDVDDKTPMWLSWIFLIGGAGLLVVGSQLFVSGAVDIAKSLGMSELVVGLTIAAVGTSAPELATSIVAARRGEGDLAIGNIVGSNILNLLLALPLIGFFSAVPVAVRPEAIWHDLPAMGAAALAVWAVLGGGAKIRRVEGGLLIGLYALFIADLIIRSQGPAPFMVLVWYVGAPIALLIVRLRQTGRPASEA